VVATAPGTLLERVAAVAEAEIREVGQGRTAVLAPELLLGEVIGALAERGLHPVDPRDPGGSGLSAPLVVLPANQANGLEFDAVVVVEPALIASGGDEARGEGPPTVNTRGLRTLYVALTRPTRRLTVMHSRPLPPGLATRHAGRS
jgi:hypothetical protein